MSEKEIYKAFEEVITRNVRSAVEHSNETRRLLRELEEKVKHLELERFQLLEKIEHLQGQLTVIQARVFSGGTV